MDYKTIKSMEWKSMGSKRLIFCVVFLSFLSSFFCTSISLSATDKINSLTVSPTKSEIELDPGFESKGKISVKNSGDKELNVYFTAEEFNVTDLDYEYSFSPGSDVSEWVTFEKSTVQLQPNQKIDINFTIGVPINTEPGGKYIGLFSNINNTDDYGNLTSKQRVASLLYLTINGEVSRSGDLLSFNSPSVIFDKGSWRATVHNTGTVHFYSRYTVKVSGIFNSKILNEKSGTFMIFPNTTRSVNGELELPNKLGLYRVIYEIGLGDTKSVVKNKIVLFLPNFSWLWMILIIISLVFITKKVYKFKKIN